MATFNVLSIRYAQSEFLGYFEKDDKLKNKQGRDLYIARVNPDSGDMDIDNKVLLPKDGEVTIGVNSYWFLVDIMNTQKTVPYSMCFIDT